MRNFQRHFDSLYSALCGRVSILPLRKFYNPTFVAFGIISDYLRGRIKSYIPYRSISLRYQLSEENNPP